MKKLIAMLATALMALALPAVSQTTYIAQSGVTF